MTLKIINAKRRKRNFPRGLWVRIGVIFPWEKRRFVQIGVFGFLLFIQYGSYK